MAQQLINVGTTANDGTGDLLRNGFIKVNQNFTELYTNRISGSGTDNYIPRFNGTNSLENSIIYDNGTNVGIGTTSPVYPLQVNGAIVSKGGGTGGLDGTIGFGDTGTSLSGNGLLGEMYFKTANSEKMRITFGGNVGIGTTSPNYKLDVNGAISSSTFLRVGDISAQIGVIGSEFSIFGAGGNDWTFYNGGATSNVFYTSGTERMRINSSGNVGIGTASPTEKLHVVGVAQILDDAARGRITFQISSTQNDLYSTTNGFGSYRNLRLSSNELILCSNGPTERMRITSAGNVGIGTTSPESGWKFDVAGIATMGSTSGNGRLYISCDNTTNGTTYIQARNLTIPTPLYYTASKHTFDTNVGIGTSSPAYSLEVNGSINVYPNNFFRYDGDTGIIGSATSIGGGASNQLGIRASNDILFATNGANERMRITSAGNVGIGTSSPTNQFEVYTNSYKQFNVSYPSIYQTRLNFGTAAYAAYDAGTATLSLFATDALYGSISFGAGGSQRMRITETGNVGIGTSNPSAKLSITGGEVSTSISNVGSTSTSVFNVANPAISLSIGYVGTDIPMLQSFNNTTNTSNNLTINPFGGNVGIGTSSPTSKLQVVGLPSYADNTTALAGGLTAGAFYHTAGVLKVVI
jgi:hypothetical protein